MLDNELLVRDEEYCMKNYIIRSGRKNIGGGMKAPLLNYINTQYIPYSYIHGVLNQLQITICQSSHLKKENFKGKSKEILTKFLSAGRRNPKSNVNIKYLSIKN